MTRLAFEQMRDERQAGVVELANAIHDAGFSGLLLESQKIGLEDYWIRIVIDQDELGMDQMNALIKVCKKFDATLTLRHDYKTGSKLAVWLPHG